MGWKVVGGMSRGPTGDGCETDGYTVEELRGREGGARLEEELETHVDSTGLVRGDVMVGGGGGMTVRTVGMSGSY